MIGLISKLRDLFVLLSLLFIISTIFITLKTLAIVVFIVCLLTAGLTTAEYILVINKGRMILSLIIWWLIVIVELSALL